MSGGDETHSVVSALPVLWSGCLRTGQNPSTWVHISSKKSKGRGKVGGRGWEEGGEKEEGGSGWKAGTKWDQEFQKKDENSWVEPLGSALS